MSYRIQPRANSTGINSQIPVVIDGQYRTFFVPPEVSILSHQRTVRLVRVGRTKFHLGWTKLTFPKLTPFWNLDLLYTLVMLTPSRNIFSFFRRFFFGSIFSLRSFHFESKCEIVLCHSPPTSFFNSLYFFVQYILIFSLMIVSLINSLNWSCLVKNGEFDFGESRIKSERKC